jgi:major membrane immunogen (membrane-anchored lipoprotein)
VGTRATAATAALLLAALTACGSSDLTKAQAKGGTLIYVDGEDAAHRWEMPFVDSGPNVADVKKHLEF